MTIHPALCLIAALTMTGHALDLKPVSPDEPADYTFNQRFSVPKALQTLEQLNSILDSFRKLTEQSKDKISKKDLKAIGNTEWDMQHLGFANLPGSIKGTLLKQEYTIQKLRYELAQQQSKTGEIGPEKLADARKEYERAEESFQKFWNSFHIAD